MEVRDVLEINGLLACGSRDPTQVGKWVLWQVSLPTEFSLESISHTNHTPVPHTFYTRAYVYILHFSHTFIPVLDTGQDGAPTLYHRWSDSLIDPL